MMCLVWPLFFFFSVVIAESGEPGLSGYLELSLKELGELDVTTPSRAEEKLGDSPGTTVVVTRQQIEERGYSNLLDLLQDMPGIDVNQKSVEERFNQITFRGDTGNNKFIILLNGVRISSPTGEPIPISDNFPLFHAKQVEIAYGPVSAVYGADAFTGVINIITEDPGNLDEFRMSATGGSNDYFNNYVNVSKTLTPSVRMALGGHWQSSQNPDLSETYSGEFQNVDALRTDGTVFRSKDDREHFTAATKSYTTYLDLRIKEKLTFGFNQSFFRHPTTIGNKPEKAVFDRNAVWETQLESYYAKAMFDYTDQLSGTTLLNYSTYETLPFTKFANNFSDFSAFKYAKGKEVKLEQQLNYRLDNDHKLALGLTVEYFNSIPKTADLPSQYDEDKDAGEQNLFYIGSDDTLPIQFFEQDYNNYGVFSQIQSKWNDWFSSTLGLRYDYDTRFHSTVNPRLNLTFKPADSTIFKLLYAEAFLAPSANQAFAHFGSFGNTFDGAGNRNSSFFHIANPDLGPEKSRTLEASLQYFFTSNFSLRTSVYATEVEDLISDAAGPSNDTTFIPGGNLNTTAIFDNVGTAHIVGADLTLDKQVFWEEKSLKYWINYSWVDGTLEEPNGISSRLPLTAKHKIKTGFTFTYLKDYFITPRLIWVGRTSHFRANRNEQVSSYALLNLHAGVRNIFEKYKDWQDFSAYLTITNLPDVKYFNAGGGSNSFGSSPQDPRRFFFEIRKNF